MDYEWSLQDAPELVDEALSLIGLSQFSGVRIPKRRNFSRQKITKSEIDNVNSRDLEVSTIVQDANVQKATQPGPTVLDGAIGADGAPQRTPQFVFRKTKSNTEEQLTKGLTRRPGIDAHLSVSEALSSDLTLKGSGRNVLNDKRGAPFVKIDVSKLPNGAADLILDGGIDGAPAGHVSIKGSVKVEQIRAAIIDKGKVPKVKKIDP